MIDMAQPERRPMENLILVPLDDSILFPGMSATIAVETGEEERVLLVPRTDGEFAGVGVVANVVERMRIPGGGSAVTVEGIARGVPGAANTDASGTLREMMDRVERRILARRGWRVRRTAVFNTLPSRSRLCCLVV